ncbi:hypothetical protein [Haloterrigena alkaliphila]|uniref:Uncharacterized protein n=1 Tax=Haloterrigena alkaliphila TaxID=2816475 RepID=A0A8A2VF21_9EURY|nr:hypothetical protein [Haloterrigena alkaliphila]QSX00112.1 hypothetical protein J0X25_03855 [Haloterrigena alkaliphila]
MDKFNSLSRRESLLGIGAAGTLLGGGALGVSSAVAGEDSKNKTDDATDGETVTSKKGRFELGLVCYEKGTAEFRVSNETGAAAKVNWTVDLGRSVVDGTDTDADDGDVDEDFDPDGETIEDGQEVDDDGDDDDDDDDNGDYSNGTDEGDYTLEGKLTVPKGASETFRADVLSKDATVTLYHDGKKVAAVDVEKLDCEEYSPADEIDLEAVCYRMRKRETENDTDENGGDGDTVSPSEPGATATYTTTLTVGSDNAGDSLNDIVADFQGTGADVSNVGDGDVAVRRNGEDVTDDLDEVSASNDGATLTLGFGGSYSLEEGDEIEVVLEDVQNPEDAGDYEATYTLNSQSAGETTTVDFTIDDGDGDDEDGADDETGVTKATEVKFRVTNDSKQKVKTNWTVQGDGQGGKCYVDGKDSETFWVTALEDQKTYVSLTYDGEEVATVKADADTECDGDC